MGPVAANLRLHCQSHLALLFGLCSAVMLLAAVTSGSGWMALTSVLFVAYLAAALYREVELCEFVRVLPAHRGMARRLIFGIALTTSLVAGYVQRDVAFLVFVAGGAAAALLMAVVTMWSPGAFWIIWMIGSNASGWVRDRGWSESPPTAAIVVASATWMLVAWRLLDQAVIDRWVSRRPQRVLADAGFDAQRRYADDMAARRESGGTIATLIIRVLASRRTTPEMRTMAALILPNGGAISLKLAVGLTLLAVAVGGVEQVLSWFGGALWLLIILPAAPLMLIQGARVTRTLPIDRRRLLWAHLRFIAYSVLACIAAVLLMNAIGQTTSRILLDLGVSHTAPSEFWSGWAAYAFPVLVACAAAPLIRVGDIAFSVLFFASIGVGVVLNHYDVTVACLAMAAAGSIAYVALRSHYLGGDLT